MLVSFDIFSVLTVIKFIFLLVYIVILFALRSEDWSLITQLVLVIVIFMIDVAELQMKIIAEKPYHSTLTFIILWFIDAVSTALFLGGEN